MTEVEHMPPGSAVAFVQRRLPDEDGADVAAVDVEVLGSLGLADRGVVRITSRRGLQVLSRVRRGPDDEGSGVIRLGQHQMKSLRAGVGESVTIELIEVEECQRVVLEPLAPLTRPITEYETELLAELSRQRQVVQPGMLITAQVADFRRKVMFRVAASSPEHAYVESNTRVVLRTSLLPAGASANLVTFDDVGGLQAEVDQIRELVETPIKYPLIYDQLGIEPPRGLLLHGPPGVGKTHLARAIANEVGAHFVYINGPEILSSLQGGTEANLRSVFEEAMDNAPAVVMIDEIDAIAPQRTESGQSDARMGTQLLSLLDGLVSMEDIVVIGTTNRVNDIDPALRRPGRFDREFLIGPPDAVGRLTILEIHTRSVPLDREAVEYLPEVARATHGYTGADLVDLVREAGLNALRRHLGAGFQGLDESGSIAGIVVTVPDLRVAVDRTHPSALREALITVPSTRWQDIGGHAEVMQRLREAVEFPLSKPEAFANIGLTPVRGVLLHGPAGTGKTMLAMAVAQASGANVIMVNGSEVFSKWLGESEEHVRDAFQLARQSAPTVLVLDQIDAMAPRRTGDSTNPASQRVVNQLLVEFDSLTASGQVVVIAVTNRPDLVDPALLRPGRLGLHIGVPLPDRAAREEILTILLRRELLSGDEAWTSMIQSLAEQTNGMAGAELAAICDFGRMLALREHDFDAGTQVEPKHVLRGAEAFQAELSLAHDHAVQRTADKEEGR